MFSKNSKEEVRVPPVPKAPAPPSLLSTDLRITGNIHSEGEIQVDGYIEGDIHAESLIIGETANVNGEVNAKTVRVHGFITGQIKADSVSLAKSAHVMGDILHESLAIEQGAFLEGHCRRPPLPGGWQRHCGLVGGQLVGSRRIFSFPPRSPTGVRDHR